MLNRRLNYIYLDLHINLSPMYWLLVSNRVNWVLLLDMMLSWKGESCDCSTVSHNHPSPSEQHQQSNISKDIDDCR